LVGVVGGDRSGRAPAAEEVNRSAGTSSVVTSAALRTNMR
jgi:hypothetical protein